MKLLVKKIENNIFERISQNSKVTNTFLSKIVSFRIPFNQAHKFKFITSTLTHTKLMIPFIRNNKNHLNTLHACCMTTAGELCAGTNLLKNFFPTKYRIILKSLDTKYLKQVKENAFAECEISEKMLQSISSDLAQNGFTDIQLLTLIKNGQDEVVAEVNTVWNLKSWDKVSFK